MTVKDFVVGSPVYILRTPTRANSTTPEQVFEAEVQKVGRTYVTAKGKGLPSPMQFYLCRPDDPYLTEKDSYVFTVLLFPSKNDLDAYLEKSALEACFVSCGASFPFAHKLSLSQLCRIKEIVCEKVSD